jgi:hypothetical protein
MNDYWAGLLTIPAVLLLVALTGTALFGAWTVFEKWAEHRLTKLPPAKVTQSLNTRSNAKFKLRSKTELGGRGIFAALFLTVEKAWFFQVGPNTGVGFVHGTGNDPHDYKFMYAAIEKAVDDAAKENE